MCIRDSNEKREGKLLKRKINSKGLKVTVESNDVEEEVNATMQAHDNEFLEVSTARYSTTTYIMMIVGGGVVAAIGIVALAVTAKEKLRKLLTRQAVDKRLAMLEEAQSSAKTDRLELEFKTDAITVAHCDVKEDRKKIKLVAL